MNINVLTLILILFFSSCSSDKEIKANISTSDDVSLYNLAMKNLKKNENMKKQLIILLSLKFNTPTHPGLQEVN